MDKELSHPYIEMKENEINVGYSSRSLKSFWNLRKKLNFFAKIYEKKAQSPRTIGFDGFSEPRNNVPNVIRNQKYNIFTFIPTVLYNQFKFFFNFFFLLTTASQFFPPLQTGYFISYVGPLALVLFLTMLKEAYDDWERYKRDKEANSTLYTRIKGRDREIIPSFALQVGDIIEVKTNQRVPADLVLLYTSEQHGSVFLRTDQLDGETDWKLRKAILYTQKHLTENKCFGDLSSKARLRANPPTENIYLFEGVFEIEQNGEMVRESLTVENTIWASTLIAGGTAYGMVVYTGREMRVVMNTSSPKSKAGKVDLEINFLSKVLFFVLAIMALGMVGIGGFEGRWYIQFFRFMILLCCIIPLSLRVNLDFAKLAYSYLINHDSKIPNTVARNSSIPEELGRIQFLLTDKTGTLTQNEMIFKALSLQNGLNYTNGKIDDLKRIIKKRWNKPFIPSINLDEDPKIISSKPFVSSINLEEDSRIMSSTISLSKKDSIEIDPADNLTVNLSDLKERPIINRHRRSTAREDKERAVKQMLTAMVLCHSVTPVRTDGSKTYQASSPDEIALVKAAEEMNVKLIHRDQNTIIFENPHGVQERYEILTLFPFSSERKRMGIILKCCEMNKVIFYLKGADSVMHKKVAKKQEAFILDECERLGKDGLRTLVFAQKYFEEEYFIEWYKKYNEARQSLVQRDLKIEKIIESLETNMECIGVTGVEDKLQDEVCDILENLRTAGIQIWMLTGDKVETAATIALTSGIKSYRQDMTIMKEMTDVAEITLKLEEMAFLSNTVLVIDGITLHVALADCHKIFFEAATKAPAVVCCRCSPTQKALITEGIKAFTKKRTCAIGDGGNDVGMIQAADVGIGIEGKEGKQAALAADYSIAQFKYLNRLILWHGRLSYKRTATLTNFVIHRGLIISFIQAIFSIVFYDLSMSIYTGILILGYTTLYTMLPVFSLISDQDIDVKSALHHPPLYKSLQKGRELSLKNFLMWLWISLYQAAVIFLGAILLFKDSYYNIVTITFSALILSELLNVLTTLNRIRKYSVVSIICSVIVYWMTILLLKNQFNVSSIDLLFIYKVVFLTLVSWLPFHLIKLIKKRIFPTEQEKIMLGAQRWVSEGESPHEIL